MRRPITLAMAVLTTIGGTAAGLAHLTNNYSAGTLDLSAFVVTSSGAPDWTNNYGAGYRDLSGLANSPIDAGWVNTNAVASPDLAAFVVSSSGAPDWTNNYRAGYPDLSGTAMGWRVPSAGLKLVQSALIAP
jgi:hypothetical protein